MNKSSLDKPFLFINCLAQLDSTRNDPTYVQPISFVLHSGVEFMVGLLIEVQRELVQCGKITYKS